MQRVNIPSHIYTEIGTNPPTPYFSVLAIPQKIVQKQYQDCQQDPACLEHLHINSSSETTYISVNICIIIVQFSHLKSTAESVCIAYLYTDNMNIYF